MCYDDACHLKRYAKKRKDLTPTAKHLASLHMVVDRMHFKGHIDAWCHKNCNPNDIKELACLKVTLISSCYRLILKYVSKASPGFHATHE